MFLLLKSTLPHYAKSDALVLIALTDSRRNLIVNPLNFREQGHQW